jgi:hypothetical protein
MERKFSIDELRHRLELALRPAEPPTVEEVLATVEKNGKLRGPADWAFPAWITYVEYAAQRIAEAFPLTEEERRQLFHFRDAMKQLLLEARRQAREKLTAIYNAIADGTYRMEGNKLYTPDGTWMYIAKVAAPRIAIHGVNTSVRFPDILKLPRERLELLQLGWRASDEGNVGGRPLMGTTQPWQVFAWAVTRYGELHVRIITVNLTRKGASVNVHIKAMDWRQKWDKAGAIDLVVDYFRHGEWAPVLTMWLGDGKNMRKKILHNKYRLVIAAKEPWKLSSRTNGANEALVATGKEAFKRLREVAGTYSVLLDLLRAHKWIDVKLATDDAFRTAYRLKTKRSIDVLREAYNGEIPTEQSSPAEVDKPERGDVVVAGVVASLCLSNGRGGSFCARRYVRDLGEALAITKKLESAGFRPNVYREHSYYVVYISMTDLLRLAERDEAVKRVIALYLADKAKNGTPWQREIAEKILKRHPLFLFNIGQHVI